MKYKRFFINKSITDTSSIKSLLNDLNTIIKNNAENCCYILVPDIDGTKRLFKFNDVTFDVREWELLDSRNISMGLFLFSYKNKHGFYDDTITITERYIASNRNEIVILY